MGVVLSISFALYIGLLSYITSYHIDSLDKKIKKLQDTINYNHNEEAEQKNWLKERHELMNRIHDLEKALGGE